jgi:hypothetical protein
MGKHDHFITRENAAGHEHSFQCYFGNPLL